MMEDNQEEVKGKKTGLIIAIVAVLLIIAGIVVYGVIKNKDTGAEEEEQSMYGDESLCIDATVDKQLKDYRNVLICGLDNNQRSDVMMVASINTKTNKVNLFNIYRDTYLMLKPGDPHVTMDGVTQEFFKCNHAYFYEGNLGAIREVNMNLDLNIREIIGMDWDAIEKFVDGVGGIDVNVTPEMMEAANQRVNSGKTIPSSGYQHLNGGQAVGYLRTRYDATAVQRSDRNEAVFVQIFEKINKMSTKEQAELLDSIIDDMDSNMSRNTMTEIVEQLAKYELTTAEDWPYDWELYYEHDRSYYYFVPITLESNVVALHQKVFGQENYKVTSTCKNISDKSEENRNNVLIAGELNFGR